MSRTFGAYAAKNISKIIMRIGIFMRGLIYA